MNRSLLLVPVAAALIGGCGGPPPATGQEPPRQSQPVQADPVATVIVGQRGTAPKDTQWYVRIETDAGVRVTEADFGAGGIDLTKRLDPGDYRVISWHRRCTDSCPQSGEHGLGPLAEVCGVPVRIAKGDRINATVVIGPEGACTVRLEP